MWGCGHSPHPHIYRSSSCGRPFFSGVINDLGDEAGLAIIRCMCWSARIHCLTVLLVGLSLLLTGCGSAAEDTPTFSWTPFPESAAPSLSTAVDLESKSHTPSLCINNARFLEDHQFSGPDELALYPARAGTAAVWQVVLEAPMEPGDYFSRWQARTPTGSLFGDEVFLLISVRSPTPTPSPELSPTP